MIAQSVNAAIATSTARIIQNSSQSALGFSSPGSFTWRALHPAHCRAAHNRRPSPGAIHFPRPEPRASPGSDQCSAANRAVRCRHRPPDRNSASTPRPCQPHADQVTPCIAAIDCQPRQCPAIAILAIAVDDRRAASEKRRQGITAAPRQIIIAPALPRAVPALGAIRQFRRIDILDPHPFSIAQADGIPIVDIGEAKCGSGSCQKHHPNLPCRRPPVQPAIPLTR